MKASEKRASLPAAAAAAVLGIAMAAPAAAQEWVLGSGYSRYSREEARDSVQVSAEYLGSPFHEQGALAWRFGGVLEVQAEGDAFAGLGVSGLYRLPNRWFAEASVMPGFYHESFSGNDLGSSFEIRSQLAVGRRFANGRALSLAISHKSNASTADDNPGVNALTLRWHLPLGG